MDFRKRCCLLAMLALLGDSWLETTCAQQPRVRNNEGWRTSPAQPALATPEVQSAFYQAQRDGFPGLPTDFSSGGGQNLNSALPQLPAPGFSPTPNTSSGQALPTGARSQSPYPPQPNANSRNEFVPNNGIAQSGINRQQPVLPTGAPRQPAGDLLPEPQGNALRTRDRDASGLRPTQDGRLDPSSIATGLPFVTQAPGRYPTSPYNHAVFQTAAYQRTRQAQVNASSAPTSGQLVAAQLPQAPSTAPPVLPQFQQPAYIYPTSYQCTPPVPSFPTAGAVPGTYVPPTYTPNLTPGLYTPNNAGYTPLLSMGQENYNVLLGRGILGQPTVYVAGQPVRNFMRYLSP